MAEQILVFGTINKAKIGWRGSKELYQDIVGELGLKSQTLDKERPEGVVVGVKASRRFPQIRLYLAKDAKPASPVIKTAVCACHPDKLVNVTAKNSLVGKKVNSLVVKSAYNKNN